MKRLGLVLLLFAMALPAFADDRMSFPGDLKQWQTRFWIGGVVNTVGWGPKFDMEVRGERFGIKLDLALAKVVNLAEHNRNYHISDFPHNTNVFSHIDLPDYSWMSTVTEAGEDQDWQIGIGFSWTTRQRVK